MAQVNQNYWETIETILAPERRAVGVKFIYTPDRYERVDAPELRKPLSYCTMGVWPGREKT